MLQKSDTDTPQKGKLGKKSEGSEEPSYSAYTSVDAKFSQKSSLPGIPAEEGLQGAFVIPVDNTS